MRLAPIHLPAWLQQLCRPPGKWFQLGLLVWLVAILLDRSELACLGFVLGVFLWSTRLVLWIELERRRPTGAELLRWLSLPSACALATLLVALGVPYRLWFQRQRGELERRILAARAELDGGAQIRQEDGPLEGYYLCRIETSYAFETTLGGESDWSNVGLLWSAGAPPPTPEGCELVPLGHDWYRWSVFQWYAFDSSWPNEVEGQRPGWSRAGHSRSGLR